MTPNEIAAKYTLTELTTMYDGAVKEICRLNNLLQVEMLNEAFKTTCKMYKDGLTEFANNVFEALKIKEKLNK